MPLALTDLDPTVAQVLREALLELPETKGRPSVALRGKDGLVPFLPALSIGGAMALVLIPFVSSPLPRWPTFALSVTIGLTLMGAGLQYHSVEAEKLNARRCELFFTQEYLQTLLQTVSLSVAQRSYVESVLVLLDLQTPLGEEPTRELLTALNGLLAVAVRLEQERSRFSGPTLEVLAVEQKAVQARLQQTTDPLARQTWEENLALLERQWLHLQTEAPLRERADAHYESALQSLRATHLLLRGLQAHTPAPDTFATVQEELRRLRTHTHAVEAAIQEVGL